MKYFELKKKYEALIKSLKKAGYDVDYQERSGRWIVTPDEQHRDEDYDPWLDFSSFGEDSLQKAVDEFDRYGFISNGNY